MINYDDKTNKLYWDITKEMGSIDYRIYITKDNEPKLITSPCSYTRNPSVKTTAITQENFYIIDMFSYPPGSYNINVIGVSVTEPRFYIQFKENTVNIKPDIPPDIIAPVNDFIAIKKKVTVGAIQQDEDPKKDILLIYSISCDSSSPIIKLKSRAQNKELNIPIDQQQKANFLSNRER